MEDILDDTIARMKDDKDYEAATKDTEIQKAEKLVESGPNFGNCSVLILAG
jgi:hypothetical protein